MPEAGEVTFDEITAEEWERIHDGPPFAFVMHPKLDNGAVSFVPAFDYHFHIERRELDGKQTFSVSLVSRAITDRDKLPSWPSPEPATAD